MQLLRSRPIRYAVLSFALVGLGAACSSSSSDGGSSGGGSTGDTCPGVDCPQAASPCMALSDNTGKTRADLRMSQLIPTAPKALTSQFVEGTVVNKNMRLKYDQTCAGITGTGGFSWLFSFDSATGKLTSGGGPPVATMDIASKGTCFINFTDAQQNHVEPVTVDSKIGADGSFSATIDKVTVPIYLDPLNPETGSIVLLPLHAVVMTSLPGAKIADDSGNPSAAGNCLGGYRKDLDPGLACMPDDTYTYFDNGGKLTGYITVAEADKVEIKDLSETFCVLLSNDSSTYKDLTTGGCKKDTDGNITLKGDWDAATNAAVPAGTGDAFHLEAEFAASAIKILGTATKADCSDAK